jgi:hypothetical protein
MSREPHSRGPSYRAVTLVTVGAGVILLLLAAAYLQIYLEHPESRSDFIVPVFGLAIDGLVSVAASWLLFRRYSAALPVYCLSWVLNIAVFIDLRVTTHSDPLWYVVGYALCLVSLALILIRSASRGLRRHEIAP